MHLILHESPSGTTAEAVSDALLIQREQDVLRLMEELFAAGACGLILHQEDLAAEFFQLRTGLAGAVLQKLVQYEIRVAIVGDFSQYTSDALKAFIYESNRGRQVFFLESVEQALQKFDAAQGY